MTSSCARKGLGGTQEEFLHRKVCQALEWVVQGSSRVAIPGSVKEPTGHGTSCYGLAHIVVFSERLDLMVL